MRQMQRKTCTPLARRLQPEKRQFNRGVGFITVQEVHCRLDKDIDFTAVPFGLHLYIIQPRDNATEVVFCAGPLNNRIP